MALPRRKAKASPTTKLTAQQEHAASVERVIGLQAKLDQNALEERSFVGERPDAEVVVLVTATRQAAEALADTGELPAKGFARKRTFHDILRERRSLELAIEIAQERCEKLRLKAGAERVLAMRDAISDAGRQLALTVIAKDRALRACDAITREVAMPRQTLPFEEWFRSARLHNTATEGYRFLELAVAQGWISQRELDDEFAAARRANP